MIDFCVLKTKISVSPLFFAVLTIVLLLDETGITGLAVLFSALHELGHILALLCEKIKPKTVKITVFGIHIKLPGNLSTAEKVPVLMAGFSVNFLLAALFFVLNNPLFGYINLIIGIFTALPIPSTDGGTILKTVLEEFLPQKAERVFGKISRIFVLIFSMLLFYVSISTKNYFIITAIIYMIFCTTQKAAR